MKAIHFFAALTTGLIVLGCSSSSKPTAAGPAHSDVMDLSDAPPAPIAPAAHPAAAAAPAEPSTAAPDPAPAAAAGPRKHVVAAKETLYSIAKQYYGEGKQYPKILAANPGLVAEHMPVGKTIIIP